MLGEDGGVTYYQLTLVPWLEMLKLGRNSRIFQNRSVVDILGQVFEGHELARGGYRSTCAGSTPPAVTACSTGKATSSSSAA
jgi:uncharacterized protein involved in type VI secretion and phage assembly